VPAPKLADGSGLEAHLQLVRDRKLRDLFVAEPADGAKLLDELATQAGFRFFGAFEAASGQAGFGESRRIPAKASMQRAYLR